MTTEKAEIKKKLQEILEKMETDFTRQDSLNFNSLLRDYNQDPFFCRERILYGKRVSIESLKPFPKQQDLCKKFEEQYHYIKKASEDDPDYQKEVEKWRMIWIK